MTAPVVRVEEHDRLAWVTIDNPPVNATSAMVRKGLLDAVRAVATMDVRAAVLRCAGRTFVAGGDIREFDAPPVKPDLPDIVRAIEDCPVPWIAAMHGSAYGGGLEIALGCAYRVATGETAFALPEVKLGIVPGAGGTQRLPRLVGTKCALEMATTGEPVSAEAFLAAGGLDAILPDLEDRTLTAFALGLTGRPEATRLRRIPAPDPAWWAKRERAVKRRAGGQESPLCIFQLVQLASRVPFDAGQSEERSRHLALRQSEQSRALRHIFFAERKAAKPAAIAGHKPRPLRSVAVVGAGPAARSLAEDARAGGLEVSLVESAEGLATAAVRPPDLAIVAGVEEPDGMRRTLRRLAEAAGPQAILSVCAGRLHPSRIFEGAPGRNPCLALHCGAVERRSSLLEIMAAPDTTAEVAATGVALARRLSRTPVVSCGRPGFAGGFVGVRLERAVRRQAEDLLAEGALPQEIDAAWAEFGVPMGILSAEDAAGLQPLDMDPGDARHRGIRGALVAAGRLGRHSGKGWYRYEPGDPTALPDPEVEAMIREQARKRGIEPRRLGAEEICRRLLAVLINEGARALEEGSVPDGAFIDVVAVVGHGFPRWRGGPMYHATLVGMDRVAGWMDEVVAGSPPGAWTVSDTLREAAK